MLLLFTTESGAELNDSQQSSICGGFSQEHQALRIAPNKKGKIAYIVPHNNGSDD
jgi:hypothetical protein